MNMWRRGLEVHSRGRPARFSALCATFLAVGLTAASGTTLASAGRAADAPAQRRSAGMVLDLKRGDVAPPVSAVSLKGEQVDLANFRGRTVVVLFAEAGSERCQQATRHIARALLQEGVGEKPVSWIIVYTKGSAPETIQREIADVHASLPATIAIHDTERLVFGAYHAVAMPSAVVIDGSGRIIHAMAGLSPRFEHAISDSVVFAVGGMTAAQFELALSGAVEQQDEHLRRAERLAQLARRLSDRGQYDLAESHFLEALSLAPSMVPARLGLADLMLRRQRYEEAEAGFRSVLHTYPKSIEAAAGLALVFALRGEMMLAEPLASEVLERSASRPRAHYVLGLVHEQRGDSERAAAFFRRAAELLMERSGSDEHANGEHPAQP
jgi:Tfp pilus assembly protein PilF